MTQVLCPVLATDQHDVILPGNINSLQVNTYQRSAGTKVSVSCYVPSSHVLDGPSQVECSVKGQWIPGVPTCVPRSNNNNNNEATTKGPGDPTINTDDSTLSDYSIIIIAVALTFVVILIIIFIVFICKYYCNNNNEKEDRDMTSSMPQPSTRGVPRSRVEYVKMDDMTSPYHGVYKGQDTAPSWHSHPIIQMSEQFGYRSWSHLSVDRFVRNMDTSRRENPNHSWRDFASFASLRFPGNSTTSI